MRNRFRIWGLAVVLAFAAVPIDLGCSTKTTTVTRESTGEDGKTETTVTTTEEEVAHPTGVLSTTFNLIGEVLALPFRLVAGIVRFIF